MTIYIQQQEIKISLNRGNPINYNQKYSNILGIYSVEDFKYLPIFYNSEIINSNYVSKYKINVVGTYFSEYRRYDDLYNLLQQGFDINKFIFKKNGEDKILYFCRGSIFNEDGKMLLSICYNSKVIDEIKITQELSDEEIIKDVNNYVIFVNKGLILLDDFNNFYKKIFKDLLSNYIENGFELRIVKNIENIIYNKGVDKRRYNTIQEMRDGHRSLIEMLKNESR